MAVVRKSSPPLDERVHSHLPAYEYWRGIHSESVYHYFITSPYFDNTSNNGILFNQARFDPSGRAWEIINSRARLEATLRSMQGLEFMVVGEPQPGVTDGVWVIRKQVRQKRQGFEDELTVRGTYYIIGENIYQAPSIADVVGNKM
ncbi:Mediator of RNA polymerase II transcription subunit 6, partial [Cryomyces antarcticus]